MQYAAAIQSGNVYRASSVTGIPAVPLTNGASKPGGQGIVEAFAFGGGVPELLNGRMAMLAFVAALGAELTTGESVVRQLADQPTLIVLTVVLFTVGTLVPVVEGAVAKAVGPLTVNAELINGRAAMLGFASLLVVERVTGSALF